MPMRPIDLLDAKDLSKLSTALRELRQVEIYKTLGSLVCDRQERSPAARRAPWL